MCGCGRTSMPSPGGRRAGPNSSTKMNGPTIVRCLLGSVRWTLNAPRSCVAGAIVCRKAVSSVAISLSRSGCADRQRVDSCLHEVTKGCIDHALPFDTAFAGECGTFETEREMALACGIVAAVPAMLLTVVDQVDLSWSECRIEPPEHFRCDRASVLGVHRAYIMKLPLK